VLSSTVWCVAMYRCPHVYLNSLYINVETKWLFMFESCSKVKVTHHGVVCPEISLWYPKHVSDGNNEGKDQIYLKYFNLYRSCFIFSKFHLYISAQRLAVPRFFCSFPPSIQANAGIVP
jgi:hypothetical protein